MKIVTGYTGTPHISSNDDQARNQGIFGADNYILDVGQKFNATLTDATTVTLEDGEGMMQGVHFRIEPGMTESVSISPGTTGYNRIDLICARYTKDAGTGVEDVSLVVIEGTPTTSTASEPSYTEGDVLGGDTLAEFPVWKVTLSGVTPTLTSLATKITPTSKKPTIEKVSTYEHTYTVTSETDSFATNLAVYVPKGTYILFSTVSVADDVGIETKASISDPNSHEDFASGEGKNGASCCCVVKNDSQRLFRFRISGNCYVPGSGSRDVDVVQRSVQIKLSD